MSAALVESVRDTVDAEESVEIHRVHGTPGVPPLALISRAQMLRAKLDLPAILAALTEAEALRAQVAQGQAREVALREALNDLYGYAHRQAPLSRFEGGVPVALLKGLNALSAPTDTAALRAIVTECYAQAFMAGMKSQQYVSGGYGVTEADLPSEAAIIDRVLGGS